MAAAAEPLASWAEGQTKQSIIDFVSDVSTEGSPNYVRPPERIAVFDNDGTLWVEQPLYVTILFAVDRVKVLAPEHPEWNEKVPFASMLKGNLRAALSRGEKSLIELVIGTHSGVTNAEFATIASEWIASAIHPTTKRPIKEMVYQPMLELLAYLRSNGFKNYVVSGGMVEFMRVWMEELYGIPPEQVIGSSLEMELVMRDGKQELMRLPKLLSFNNENAKPINISRHIGRRPIAAFGNSDGDLQMLQWTTDGEGARFGLFVRHTDADREWSYDRKSSIGKLNKGLDEAEVRGWTVVDMKRDWKRIFPREKE